MKQNTSNTQSKNQPLPPEIQLKALNHSSDAILATVGIISFTAIILISIMCLFQPVHLNADCAITGVNLDTTYNNYTESFNGKTLNLNNSALHCKINIQAPLPIIERLG